MHLLRWVQILLNCFWIQLKFKPVILCETVCPPYYGWTSFNLSKAWIDWPSPWLSSNCNTVFFLTSGWNRNIRFSWLPGQWPLAGPYLQLYCVSNMLLPLLILEWNGHLPQVPEPTSYHNSLSIPWLLCLLSPTIGSVSFTGEPQLIQWVSNKLSIIEKRIQLHLIHSMNIFKAFYILPGIDPGTREANMN